MLQGVRLRSVAIGSTLILLILVACRKPDTPQETTITHEPAAPLARSAGQRIIGVSLWKTDDPWRAQLKTDIEAAAAKHPDLRLVIRDAHNDVAQQESDLERFLVERVDLIIISPISAQTLAEPVANAFAAGIPVIVLDRAVVGDRYTCLIAPDNRQIGTAVGVWLAAKLGGRGKIVEIQGPVDSLPSQELHAAFRAALRDPGYRFVYEGHVDPPRIDGARVMRESLEHTKQVDAVYAYSDEAAQAACETAKLAGREKGVLFVGVGGLSAGGQQWVSQGILDASFLRPTGGSEAVETAVKLLAGQKVSKTIVPSTRVFTKMGSEQLPVGRN